MEGRSARADPLLFACFDAGRLSVAGPDQAVPKWEIFVLEAHPEALEPREVKGKAKSSTLGLGLEMRPAAQYGTNRLFRLDPCQWSSQAVVDAGAEGRVPAMGRVMSSSVGSGNWALSRFAELSSRRRCPPTSMR